MHHLKYHHMYDMYVKHLHVLSMINYGQKHGKIIAPNRFNRHLYILRYINV